jgi:GNAT superfamily N-acetyltransferase
MASTDQTPLVRLAPDDAAAGLLLSTEAHWNQNEADWRFFLSQGTAFGVRNKGARLVASAALLPFSSGNAWISMVLVTESWRRRGLATKLVDACLAAAAKQGLTTWLDATPAGAAVYGPLGFKPTLQLRRLRLEQAMSTKAEAPPSLSSIDLDTFVARDRLAMGFDRTALLTELGDRSGSRLLSNGEALALVNEIVRSENGPLLIDAVFEQQAFLSGLTGAGWKIERPFQRMRFGDAAARPAELPFAVAGPEFG